jgi:hypothetical protein
MLLFLLSCYWYFPHTGKGERFKSEHLKNDVLKSTTLLYLLIGKAKVAFIPGGQIN